MSAKTIRMVTLLGAVVLTSGWALSQELPLPAVASAAQVEQWITDLGDERFEIREAASRSLAGAGNQARVALEKAAKSGDAEVASRAKALLGGLPKLSHTVVDALGQPIPDSAVTIEFSRPPAVGPPPPAAVPPPIQNLPTTVTGRSEEDGRIAVPEVAADIRITVMVAHQDYGRARVEVDRAGGNTILQVPLVRRGTEAHRRAITGQVVATDGKPVAGALIQCSDVRTPGEGLIEGRHPRGESLTDGDGRFVYYLPPSDVRRSERGALIPTNSRYRLQIAVPGDEAFFPWSDRYSNVQPVRIELPRATSFHRFRFEAADGGIVSDQNVLQQVRVQFERSESGERMLTDLGKAAVVSGRKLLAGKYVAECLLNGKTIQYLPLVVADDSPEELTFRLPHAVTFRGRVVSGVTGEPAADSLLMGWNSTSRNNLALLTADDWTLLKDTPSNPPADHPAIIRMREFYGVQALVRTDRDGRFEIIQQPDQEFYGLLAFAEDAVPFKVTVGSLKPDAKHQINVGELPLFPAAKIVVRPVFDGQSLAVCPRWFPADSGQPQWFEKFKAVGQNHERDFEYVHWLKLNEPQPVYVPASVRVTVRFDTPYDDKWDSAAVKDIHLEQRTSKEIGDLHFAANVPVSVRVVDMQGKSIEGVPVRQKYVEDNAWSVAHNTDQEGLAHFHTPRNSEVEFWVSDLPGPMEVRMAPNLFAKLKVGDASPAEPASITLTEAQAELLLGKGK